MDKIRITIRPIGDRLIGEIEGKYFTRPTREHLIGTMVKIFPDHFGIDTALFNLRRPSPEIGAIILANPEAFRVVIVESPKREPRGEPR